MTVAATKARGFAVAVKGSLGWFARCESCDRSSVPDLRHYMGDATKIARAHNANRHGHPDADEAYGLACWEGSKNV